MSILVGTNTALFDDPELTTRLWPGNNPVRLVLDKTLRLPAALKLFDGRYPTIVFNAMRQEEHPNLMYHRLSEKGSMVQQIVQALDDLKMQSVLVEGGTQLLQSFLDAGLWDEAVVITNQQMALRKGVAAPQLQQHRLVAVQTLFSDSIQTYAHARNTLL
jgi:diaminohydroxyphosphoribosylaminopyrimidine deaminase/5-amino-6-(5-phosphoribosylamino)uracil reductase